VAGQVGVDPARRSRWPTSTVRPVSHWPTCTTALHQAGADPSDVVMTRAYSTLPKDVEPFNAVYAAALGGFALPARTAVFVGPAQGPLVEVEALAVLR